MTKSIGTSLRTRLLLIVFLAVIPPLALLGYMGTQIRAMAAENTLREAAQLGRLASAEHGAIIAEIRQLLTTLAVLPEIRHPMAADCQDLLARLRTSQPYIANVGVIDLEGEVVCSGLPFAPPVNVLDRSYFQRALTSGEFSAGEYQLGRITHLYTINFGYPVRDDAGETRSVVFAAIDLSWLNHLADEVELQEGSTLTVFDRNGTVLARHPSGADWTGQSVPQTPLMQEVRLNPEGGAAQVVDLDREYRLFAFTALAGAGEGVVLAIGTSTDVAYGSANRAVAGLLIGASFIVVVTLLMAWYGADAFALRRLRRLLSATEKLAAGDLAARVGPPYGPTELGALSLAFDDLALKLEKRNAEWERSRAEIERVLRGVRTASDWVRLLANDLPPNELMQQACEVAVGRRGYRAAWLWLADPSGERLHRSAGSGILPQELESLEVELGQRSPAGGEGVLLAAISRSAPTILRDLASIARVEGWIEPVATSGCVCMAIFPFRAKDASPGGLVLCDEDPDAFGDDEIQALAQVVRTLGTRVGRPD